jgi:Phage integrase, N-terminal SAM-like domain
MLHLAKNACKNTRIGVLHKYAGRDRSIAVSQRAVIKGIETLAPCPPHLLDEVHDAIRRLHYSRRTEEAWVHWIKGFVIWSGRRPAAVLGDPEVSGFLSHVASERNVLATTQKQALATLLFLYKQVGP